MHPFLINWCLVFKWTIEYNVYTILWIVLFASCPCIHASEFRSQALRRMVSSIVHCIWLLLYMWHLFFLLCRSYQNFDALFVYFFVFPFLSFMRYTSNRTMHAEAVKLIWIEIHLKVVLFLYYFYFFL